MHTAILAGLRSHARRLFATTLAVVLGVSFVAGTLIFTDTARAAFFDTYARLAKNVDAAVEPAAGPVTSGLGRKPEQLTPAQVEAVRHLSGAASVVARMQASAPLLGANGRVVTNFGQAGVAISTDGDPRLRGFDLTGHAPATTGEAVLDKDTVAHQRFHIGDLITVVDPSGGRHSYTLVGLIDLGTSKQISGQSVVGLPAAEITKITGERNYHEIEIAAARGTSPASLVQQIRRALGPGPRVLTGDQRRAELANDATSVATQLQFVLLIFAVISLLVAAFVIYNTFAALLAQRARETALLRCVGAARRQIFTSVVAEATAVGAAGGIAGLILGVGVAYAMTGLLDGIVNAGIPVRGVVIAPATIVVGLVLGVVTTVVAALVPAIRSTRTAPLVALRDVSAAATPSARGRLWRLAVTIACASAGTLLTIRGAHTTDAATGTYTIVAGGVVAFVGVLVATPLFVGPLIVALGALPQRLFGTPVRLAILNARRNPGRTAVTSATLMIGVGLMALFSVLVVSLEQTASEQISSHYPVDYVMQGVSYEADGTAPIPDSYASALREMPQFRRVVEVREATMTIDGHSVTIAALDPGSINDFLRASLKTGSAGGFGAGTAIVSSTMAGVHIGDPLTVVAHGRTGALRVAGTAVTDLPAQGEVDALVSWDQMSTLVGAGTDSTVLAKATDGVSAVQARDALDRLGGSYPLVSVSSVADFRNSLQTTVNGLLALFGGLLAMTILIALFGIANTISLSVLERTRESATVRALGLTRGQMRASLLAESAFIGLVGACIGIAYGLIFGPLVVREAFAGIGPVVVTPWIWLVGLAALAGVAAIAAAALPARRAGRNSIVASMAEQ